MGDQNINYKNLFKKSVTEDARKNIVYGLYDNSNESLSKRIDDFLIDHSKVSLQEKAYFFQLLAVMIDAGIDIVSAISILAYKTPNVRFARVLNTIVYNVKQGTKLSVAMSHFPDLFDEMIIGVVRSGEAAGNLDKMLMKLAEQLNKTNALQIKLISAAVYPMMVLGVLVIAASLMLVFVIPTLSNLLTQGGLEEKDFPLMTRILINSSNFLQSYWWLVILGLVTLYFIFKVWKESENGKIKWDADKLKFPVIGILLRKVYMLRFVSNLGILIESGLPVIKTLEIIAQGMASPLYSMKIWEAINQIKNGKKISESIEDTPFLFDRTVTQMLSVGEQTASIGKISEKIAAQYDLEIDNSLKGLMSLFEPVMIILVGLTVAVLALAIMTPIFQMSQLV